MKSDNLPQTSSSFWRLEGASRRYLKGSLTKDFKRNLRGRFKGVLKAELKGELQGGGLKGGLQGGASRKGPS